MAFDVRLLRKDDDRSSFYSGDPALDAFFSRFASQNQFRHKVGVTYVVEGEGRIRGYATVTATNIEADLLIQVESKKYPPYPLPVMKLARLATDERDQGKSVGSALLAHVLEVALKMAREIGCVGVVTDAKPRAVAFYEGRQFVHLDTFTAETVREAPTPMFLSSRKIEAVVEAA